MSERLDLLIIDRAASSEKSVKPNDCAVSSDGADCICPYLGILVLSHSNPRAGFDNCTMTEAARANNPVSGGLNA